ncbi:CdaR family protein [Clostridium sp. LBM24168]
METKISQNQIFIKICCVITSFVLWLYIFNVENPIRQRKIVVPVKIVNKTALSQSNLVQIEDKNYEVSLDIKGNASDVFSIKPQDFKLECDLSSYVMKKGENNIPVKIKKSPDNISIVNNGNLWVAMELDSIVKKTFPIKLIIDGETKNGLHAVKPVLNVKKAVVSGPSSVVYNLSNVVARYNIGSITKSVNVKVTLEAEDLSGAIVKNVNINPKYVNINIPVGNVKSVPVEIKTVGKVQDNLILSSIVSYPDKVDISGNYDIISSIGTLDTEPLNLDKISNSGSVDMKLIVPNGVNLINSNGYVILKVEVSKSKDSNKISEKSFSLKINVENLSNNYTAKLDNSNSSIVVSGSDNILNNLDENAIHCFVDLSSMSYGERDVPLNVTLPEGVSLISKNPQNVKVVISKKTAEVENAN